MTSGCGGGNWFRQEPIFSEDRFSAPHAFIPQQYEASSPSFHYGHRVRAGTAIMASAGFRVQDAAGFVRKGLNHRIVMMRLIGIVMRDVRFGTHFLCPRSIRGCRRLHALSAYDFLTHMTALDCVRKQQFLQGG